MTATIVAYVLVVAAATALVARRKGRSGSVWFVGGLAGGIPLFLLALLAPRAGTPWRSRALLAVALFGVVVLLAVLLVVAISQAQFTF
jgi:hypothetical protein